MEHDWDGNDRRSRNDDYYYQEQKPKSPFNWSILVPIIFTILSTISGFIFGLYTKITNIEYKQTQFQEKLEERKADIQEIKSNIKNIDEKIDSNDMTMMELYRTRPNRNDGPK